MLLAVRYAEEALKYAWAAAKELPFRKPFLRLANEVHFPALRLGAVHREVPRAGPELDLRPLSPSPHPICAMEL